MRYLNRKYIAIAVGVGMSVFHLYTGLYGSYEPVRQRSVHLLFVLLLVFVAVPVRKIASERKQRVYDVVDVLFVIASLVSLGYLLVNFDYVAFDRIYFITPLLTIEKVLGIVTIIVLLEAGRRTVGMFLSLLAAAFVAYVFTASYMPGFLHYPNVSLSTFIDLQYLTTEGIFGIPLGISATYIVLFILFGSFMVQVGFGEFLTNTAKVLAGHKRGGPAKIAIITSAFFGTINGSGSGNVAVTGTFTIPMMKNAGFKPKFAAAVESVASTGGQIMPPVMGSAAFVMAQYSGIPYVRIIVHAMIPALLFFSALYFMVDLEAAKLRLPVLEKEDKKVIWSGLKNYGLMIIPIILLLYLLASGRTPFNAVTMSIMAVIGISFLRKETRMGPKDFVTALYNGAKGTVIVAIACALAGMIIGSIYATGLGDRFTSLIVDLSGESLLVALIVAMVSSLILGMGMPTTAAYVMQVALIIPALITLGLVPLSAHFFAFYFACLSLITPPVATASYVAAGIADAPMAGTAVTGAKIALVSYIVPFMFVYEPALLLVGPAAKILVAVPTALIGVYAFVVGVQGFWRRRLDPAKRLIIIVSALLMVYPGWRGDIVGIVVLALLFSWEVWRARALEISPGPS